MDNNKSFSLQFNPLTNVKCVKDYEEEIASLKVENFELKTQLTHHNIPKVLYENKQEMETIQNAYENLNRGFQNLLQEKKLLENKYNQDMTIASEKNSFIEDENKRLLLRLEKLNREVQETVNMRNEVLSLREMIQNNEKQGLQQKYIYEREIEDIKTQFETYKREADNEIKLKSIKIDEIKNQFEAYKRDANNELESYKNEFQAKSLELENQRKRFEQVCQKEKNNSFVINDLKTTLNSQIKDKSLIEDLLSKNQLLESKIKEKEREQKVYLNGMEKFKNVISKKMNEVSSELQETNENFLKVKSFCHISDENYKLFSKLNVKYSNFNEIINFFKERHSEAYKKIEILRKEATDAVFFASNTKNCVDKKTINILQEFKEQFNEAKNELLVCKRYLEKKALENKALRNENGRLMNEALMRVKDKEILLSKTRGMMI